MQSSYKGETMSININEAVENIKKVGVSNTRIIPGTNGKCQIEINESGNWRTIVASVDKKMAESIVSQASNRTILG